MPNQSILIIDAFSGGRFYSEIARNEFGTTNYHLLSSPNLPEYYLRAFRSEHFAANFTWTEEVESQLLAKFKELKISAIIPGTETGVILADYLSHKLNLPTNGVEKSSARRSKYQMHKTVELKGLRIPKQFRATDQDSAIHYVSSNLTYPIMVKPEDSAGSDSCYVVKSDIELKNAITSVLGKVNKLGILNVSVLIQELIVGEEFAVNSVSANGKHYITHIWHYHKVIHGDSKIYDWEEYIDHRTEIGSKIKEYTIAVLNSLDIKFGAGHTEIMIDELGPVLLESASRVDGMCNPKVDNEILGTNQIKASLISYLYPELLEEHFKSTFKISGYAANVSLISNKQSKKVIKRINHAALKNLESYKDVRWAAFAGENLVVTTDIFTSPGFVYMFNQDKNKLLNDYNAIRMLEQQEDIFLFE